MKVDELAEAIPGTVESVSLKLNVWIGLASVLRQLLHHLKPSSDESFE